MTTSVPRCLHQVARRSPGWGTCVHPTFSLSPLAPSLLPLLPRKDRAVATCLEKAPGECGFLKALQHQRAQLLSQRTTGRRGQRAHLESLEAPRGQTLDVYPSGSYWAETEQTHLHRLAPLKGRRGRGQRGANDAPRLRDVHALPPGVGHYENVRLPGLVD